MRHDFLKYAYCLLLITLSMLLAAQEKDIQKNILSSIEENDLVKLQKELSVCKNLNYAILYIDKQESTSVVSPLFQAIKYKRPEIVKLLVENGADLRFSLDESPLSYAVLEAEASASVDLKRADVEIIKILLRADACCFELNREGRYPWEEAYLFNRNDIMDLFQYATIRPQILFSKAVRDNAKAEVFRELLETDMVDIRGDDIGSIVYEHNSQVLKLLLDYGANPNYVQYCESLLMEPKSLLMIAIEEGDNEIFKILLKHPKTKLDLNLSYTALMYAIHKNRLDYAKTMIARGASLSIKNHRGETALFYAAECKDNKFFEWLLQKYDGIYDIDNGGNSILMIAARNGDLDKIKLILEKEPRLLILKNLDGDTAEDIAISRKHDQIAAFLKDCALKMQALLPVSAEKMTEK